MNIRREVGDKIFTNFVIIDDQLEDVILEEINLNSIEDNIKERLLQNFKIRYNIITNKEEDEKIWWFNTEEMRDDEETKIGILKQKNGEELLAGAL